MQDHSVAWGEVGNGRSDFLDPARVLVTESERQLWMRQRLPLALIDVQVGTTQAGRSNTYQDIERPCDLGLRNIVQRRTFVILVQPYCLHERSPPCCAAGIYQH
jgi:hypothetical protein